MSRLSSARSVDRDQADWRSSLFAGFRGALASQLWFVASVLSDAAPAWTLALIEARWRKSCL